MSNSLQDSPALIVRQLLVDLGLAMIPVIPIVSNSWPVYYSFLPDQPDQAICVYSTTGIKQGRFQVSGATQIHHGIQVVVRSRTAAEQKARAIYKALDEQVANAVVDVGDSTYEVQAVSHAGEVREVGLEAPITKRNFFIFNSVVAIEPLVLGTGT